MLAGCIGHAFGRSRGGWMAWVEACTVEGWMDGWMGSSWDTTRPPRPSTATWGIRLVLVCWLGFVGTQGLLRSRLITLCLTHRAGALNAGLLRTELWSYFGCLQSLLRSGPFGACSQGRSWWRTDRQLPTPGPQQDPQEQGTQQTSGYLLRGCTENSIDGKNERDINGLFPLWCLVVNKAISFSDDRVLHQVSNSPLWWD